MVSEAGGNGNGSKPVEAEEAADRYPKIDHKLLDPTGVMSEPGRLPGWDNVPFKGAVPDLKDKDPRTPETGYQAYVRVFHTNNAEDMKYYEKLYQAACNGFVIFSQEDRKWVESKECWQIWLRWAFVYSYMPEAIPHREGF